MPRKNFIRIRIPALQPDRCIDCPLLGLVPKRQLPKGSLETFVCMPTRNAMTARLTRSKVSEADKKHPRHRYCERLWPAWATLSNGVYNLSYRVYLEERLPLEESMQLPIKFHTRK